MRLTELDPRWLEKNGVRVGFLFRCPLEPSNPNRLQAVFFRPTPPLHEQGVLIAAALDLLEESDHFVQRCNPAANWDCSPPAAEATFENISITPSVDGSAGGNWHGWITNGEIVGGIESESSCPVAQLVERSTVNRTAAGSSPAGAATLTAKPIVPDNPVSTYERNLLREGSIPARFTGPDGLVALAAAFEALLRLRKDAVEDAP